MKPGTRVMCLDVVERVESEKFTKKHEKNKKTLKIKIVGLSDEPLFLLGNILKARSNKRRAELVCAMLGLKSPDELKVHFQSASKQKQPLFGNKAIMDWHLKKFS